jgi:hypothetical protein
MKFIEYFPVSLGIVPSSSFAKMRLGGAADPTTSDKAVSFVSPVRPRFRD